MEGPKPTSYRPKNRRYRSLEYQNFVDKNSTKDIKQTASIGPVFFKSFSMMKQTTVFTLEPPTHQLL